MDSHVPETSKTVPISAKEDQSTKTTDQNQDLDELIKDYLLCLDKYSTTQSNAGTAFSRGFLDLAKANSSTMIRTLGKVSYDERPTESTAFTINIDDTGSDFELEELPLNKQVSLGLSSSFSIRTAQKEFQQAIRETLEARKLRIQVETLADHIEEIKRRQQKEKSSEVKPPEPETTDNNEEKSE